MVEWLKDWPRDRRVAGSISEPTNFLTNGTGQDILTPVCASVPVHQAV